jgi:hypothetical protein
VARLGSAELLPGPLSPNTGARHKTPASSASPSHGSSAASTLLNGNGLVLSSGSRRTSNSSQSRMIDKEIQKIRDASGRSGSHVDESEDEFDEEGDRRRSNRVSARISVGHAGGTEDVRKDHVSETESSVIPTNAHSGVEDGFMRDGLLEQDTGTQGEEDEGPRNITWADDHGYSLYQVCWFDDKVCNGCFRTSTLLCPCRFTIRISYIIQKMLFTKIQPALRGAVSLCRQSICFSSMLFCTSPSVYPRSKDRGVILLKWLIESIRVWLTRREHTPS